MTEPPRNCWLGPLLAAVLVLALLAALLLGSVKLPPAQVMRCLWEGVRGVNLDEPDSRILLYSRLPRVLLAGAVGMALALAGLASQTLFRNPLASPYVVGVSGGAAVGAVVTMLLMGARGVTFALVPAFSLAGGLAVAVAVFALARGGTHFGHSLLLAGIAIGTLCSSLTAGALYLAGERLQVLVFWLMGGFWRAGWRDVLLMAPVATGIFVLLVVLAPAMNVSMVGERSARDLGLRVRALQYCLLACVAVATALAVSLAGMIGFVGLVVPHVFRLLAGNDHRRLVPLVALGGALLLVVADTVARTATAPVEIPVGILTALVGAPVFLYLLQRKGFGRPGT